MEEKVSIFMGANAVERFARTLYKLPWLTIWTREIGLQNAIDATRKEKSPRVCISLEKGDENVAEVSVDDNGVGMTRDIFKTAYLGIGETGKVEIGDAGGFGVATAVVLSSTWWEVHTNGLKCDKDGMVLRDVPARKGTLVTCRNKVSWSDQWADMALIMVYLSEVDVQLMIAEGGKIYHTDEHAGKALPTMKLVEQEGDLKVSILDGPLPMPAAFKARRTGWNIIRLHGLVQYATWSNNDRKCNLVFDITPTCRPTDDGYPFTLSREGLKGELQEKVDNIINRFEVDQITSVRNVSKPKTREHITTGKLLRGKRARRQLSMGELNPNIRSELIQLMVSRGEASGSYGATMSFNYMSAEEQGKLLSRILPEDEPPMVFLENYDGRPQRSQPMDLRILQAWQDILEDIAPPDVGGFGIGLTLDKDVYGKHCVRDGVHFYLVNPDAVILRKPNGQIDRKATAIGMWETACHELIHFSEEVHNESFSVSLKALVQETIQIMLENLGRWSAM